MNAVVARVLDCFYLMEHSMVHQYKCRDCKNTVFCISNMQKTVFLQSLRMIFKKKINFWGITECSKHYFSNSCIDHFKTKVTWIHYNIQEILLLPSLHLSPPYLCSKVSICQVVWLSGFQVFRLSGCQVVRLSRCQVWSLGHAEQLLFSCLCSKVTVYRWNGNGFWLQKFLSDFQLS